MSYIQQLTIPHLPVSRFILHFASREQDLLPRYSGSAWRGAFGHALKNTVCVVKNTPCRSCMLLNTCAYSCIFETPPPAGSTKMRRYSNVPHPFVITPQGHQQNDRHRYRLQLTLIGNSLRYLPYLIHAFKTAGERGIGSRRQIFELREITQQTAVGSHRVYLNGTLEMTQPSESPDIPECPRQLRLRLLTPLRIKQQGRNSGARRITFSALFGNLLRRISMLSYFHTDTPLETDFAALTQKAAKISFTEQQLNWQDWTRYSSRQETTMQMGGLLGVITLQCDDLTPFWPYLWLGQWVHAGKGTSMGLGAYQVEAANLPPLQSDQNQAQ